MYTDKETKKIKRIIFPVVDITSEHLKLYFSSLPPDSKIWKFEILNSNKEFASIYISHHSFPSTDKTINSILSNNEYLPYHKFIFNKQTGSYYIE